MFKQLAPVLVASAALVGLPAVAADNGVYLGGSVGLSSVQDDSINYDADAVGFKLIGGWRFLDWLAVEGNYVDFGSADDRVFGERIETQIDGLSLSAVGFLPVGPVDLFARLGAINWDGETRSPTLGRGSDDGTDLAYGVGVQFRVWSLSLRAEYEIFDIDGADLDMMSLGVTWTFF